MPSYNRVILIGNLTRDPELRYLPKGTAVAQIGLAVNRKWRDAESGETKEEVTFVDIESFGKQAEVIAQYLKKGRPIMVEGRLKLDSWEDKQTQQKRSKLKVVMEAFEFLDSGSNREGGMAPQGGSNEPARPRPAAAPSSRPSSPAAAPEPDGPPPEEDDVPF